ncbi:hypothetical protein E2C01_062276 [Portunus trituberculatus]|uniref:Uncharacterized protein n=1 Tax=Portunus trituberculatus TaxID=210409 RepID=A0A5B7HHK9_PORTR|nr:hypothetical protein [Portunus trituberculatus]
MREMCRLERRAAAGNRAQSRRGRGVECVRAADKRKLKRWPTLWAFYAGEIENTICLGRKTLQNFIIEDQDKCERTKRFGENLCKNNAKHRDDGGVFHGVSGLSLPTTIATTSASGTTTGASASCVTAVLHRYANKGDELGL